MEQGLLIRISSGGDQSSTAVTSNCSSHEDLRHSSAADGGSSVTVVVVLSTFCAVCASFCYGCAVGYSSPVESSLMQDLGLSLASYSIFGSIMTIGGMVGAIVSGKLSDRLGRKKISFYKCLNCNIHYLEADNVVLSSILHHWMVWHRLRRGCLVAIHWETHSRVWCWNCHLCEVAPTNYRGAFAAANQLMITCGFALVYFIGTIIPWRVTALISAVPCLVQIVGLFFIPESPRWLARYGKEKDFEASLSLLRGKQSDISEEASDIRKHLQALELQSEATFLDLFQAKYANSLFVGVGLMLLQQLSGNSAMAYYGTSIFEQAGFSGTLGSQILAVTQIPVSIMALLLMDKSGRKPLLLVSSAGICASSLLAAIAFCLKEHPSMNKLSPILIVIAILMYATTFSIGLAGIPWIIMAEVFPLNVKAPAGSLVTLVNWSISWMTTYTFNSMMECSSAGTFFMFTGINAFTIVFVAKFVPETKGRTLEEVQALLTPFL